MPDSAPAATFPASVLGPERRSENWCRLAEEEFDLLIVGGGVVGCGSAVDAATRGLSVALVEARDFASGTSSRSSKMFHGGLRYLEQLDFSLVAEALRERELSMSRLAPHLVTPLEFLFPLTRRGWERPYMAAGFVLYDVMGGAKTVPAQRHYTRAGAMEVAPGLRGEVLHGGIRYWDTLVDDARHTLTLARTAARHGAVVRTSTQVVGYLRDGDRVVGATVVDTETGERTDVRARVVLTAAGVWTDELRELAGADPGFTVRASKGVHIVVPRDRIDSKAALILRTEKSVLFVIPWGAYWIIGTTDTDWAFDVDRPTATRADIDYILDHVNAVVREPIGHDDIEGVYAGLRPLLSGDSDSTTKLSREHAVASPTPGLVVIAGGKYTTYRVMAADAVDAVAGQLGREVPASVTEHTPLLGADGFLALRNSAPRLAARHGLDVAQIDRLLARYGSLVEDVLALAEGRPELLETVEGAPAYLGVELVHAATAEAALHLEDLLVRRTRISMEYAHRGVASARHAAELVAPVLGWDAARTDREVALFTAAVAAAKAAEAVPGDTDAVVLVDAVPDPREGLVDLPGGAGRA